MTIRAILFDIDGTLVDSNEQHVAAWAFAFREAGHPQEPDAIREQIGKGGDKLIPALLPDAGDDEREAISEAHGSYFKDVYLDRVQPFDGATALLRAARAADRQIVLASSAKREELEHYVALLDVGDLLDATVSIDDVGTSKPAPDIFAAALEKLGIGADQAIAVGDTPYDVESAAKSGIAAIGLTSGPFDEARLRDAGAVAVYRDVAELLDRFDTSPLAG